MQTLRQEYGQRIRGEVEATGQRTRARCWGGWAWALARTLAFTLGRKGGIIGFFGVFF